MSDYCHLCDFDPCTCGQHGAVAPTPNKVVRSHGGPRRLADTMREFVLERYEAGTRRDWGGWLDLLNNRFGPDRTTVRNTWNRVSNDLERNWLLIDPQDGRPLAHPSQYPHMQRLSLEEAVGEIERLIESGGWTVDERGLRLWQVVTRVPGVVYISIYDALHELNRRDHLVTTKAPSGKRSQFWYVKRPEAEA